MAPAVVNVKTHRGPGEVGVRVLQASSSFAFETLGRWLVNEVLGDFQRLEHIPRYSKHLITILDITQLGEGDVFFRTDVNDFFMAGRHDSCAASAGTFASVGRSTAAREATEYCLAWQHVATDMESGWGCATVGSSRHGVHADHGERLELAGMGHC